MRDTPRVSIGMPVCNGGRYLEQALESLLGQTFADFELIISDNASTDDTAAICQRYAAADPRIRYHRNERNLGAAANYNRVFELARGEYFKWAAHDDACAPACLERCVEALDDAGDAVVLCAPQTVLIDEAGQPLGQYDDWLHLDGRRAAVRMAQLASRLSLCNPVFGLIRASALRRTRLIGRYVGADIVLLTELALQGRFWQVSEPLFYRRIHGEMSRRKNAAPEDAAAWFDPRASRRFARFIQTRLLCEQARAIVAASIPWWEKPLCGAALLGAWSYKRLRARAGLVKRCIVKPNGNAIHRLRPIRTASSALPEAALKVEGSK